MHKCYCFDLFYESYRTRYEYECERFSQAVEAMSWLDSSISVCTRYIVQRLDVNGDPLSSRYNMIRSEVPFNLIPYSKSIYDSTIRVPFLDFLSYLDDEPETRPEDFGMTNPWSRR